MDQSKAYEKYVLSKTNVQLESAVLEGLTIKKNKMFGNGLYNELSFEYKMNGVHNQEVEAFLKVNICGKNLGDLSTVLEIECIYRGIFKAVEEITDEDFINFVQVQVIPQLVPYARTVIASLSVQMGIQPITLPTMDIIQSLIKNADDLVSEDAYDSFD